MAIECSKRKTVKDDLSKYDYFAEPCDFIEVTQWSNGEGYDISFNDKEISLSFGQLDAINYLVQTLEYNYNDDDKS
jgi:hypothetical protein